MKVNWLKTEESTDFLKFHRIFSNYEKIQKLNTREKVTFYPAAKAELKVKSCLLSRCKCCIEGKKLLSIQLLPLGLMDPIRHGELHLFITQIVATKSLSLPPYNGSFNRSDCLLELLESFEKLYNWYLIVIILYFDSKTVLIRFNASGFSLADNS